jgi:hypothetical protein
VNKENRVNKVRLVQAGQLVRRDPLVRKVKLVHEDNRVSRVVLAHRDKAELQESKVKLVLQVKKVLKV